MKRIIVLCSILLLLVPLNALAQDFCEGDFDYDRDQDGTDAFTFKTDFGRSALKNPCPPDGPAPVGKTGQTNCYSQNAIIDCTGTGQDGEYQKGMAWPNPRFTDNGDGTVMDNLTGLIWLKNADCFGLRSWNNALSDSNGLENGECGLTDGSAPGDWRLSNVNELLSLIDRSRWSPALPSGHPFTNVQSATYWSSNTYALSAGSALYVAMHRGFVNYDPKDSSYFVWPVRGGQ